MPHSSGGGSHSGGFHSGSGYHGSSSSIPARRTGTSGFAGATRYVFYTGNKPNYIYANYDITRKPKYPLWVSLIWLVPFFVFPVFLFFIIMNDYPEKLSTDYNTGYYVDDRIGVIKDDSEILERMDDFFELTGITPVFQTIYNEDWNTYYKKLENYAYDEYVNTFSDEKHVLIIYSEPKDKNPDFTDWYWEMQQGDETDGILTEDVGNYFGKTFQKNLTNNKVSVEEALVASFDEITPGLMDKPGDKPGNVISFICFALIWEAMFVALGIFIIVDRYGKKAKQYQSATKCPETVVEEACEYCTGIYVVGTCLSCPHCGAPIPPHTYTK